jgi:hypothetical protein
MIIFSIGASPLESHIEQFIKDHETDTIHTVSLDKLDKLKHPKHFCINFNNKSNWQGILRYFRGEVDQIIFDWSVEKDVEGFGIIDIFYKLLKNDGKLYMYNGIQGNIYHSNIWVSDGYVKMLVYFDYPPYEEFCDFKCAKQNFGYFINRGGIPDPYYIYTGKNEEILTIIGIKYNTLNERYIKHKLEGNFKVEFCKYDEKVYPIQHPRYQPNSFAERYVIATKIDKDERRREASPSREARQTTIWSRSPSRFKRKKKSKKVSTKLTVKNKKSTKKLTKKLTKKSTKKSTKKKSLV